ncbi:MAG: hypothetical protein Q9169_008668, partial [Polycauliona sp. 2 TL-2023]
MVSRAENFTFIPTQAPMPAYGHNIASPVGLTHRPPVAVQTSAMGHHAVRQNPPKPVVQRWEIIVQNLHHNVTEHWLRSLFSKSVGPVQNCRIEERGDKKRHALVSFTHADHAQAAIAQFDDKAIEGRKVHVRLTKEVQEGPVIIDGS